jgi:hypothetical protein
MAAMGEFPAPRKNPALTQRVAGWKEKVRNVEVRKEVRQRTEYEHECPCTVAYEEVDDGGAAPAIAQSN